jgi:hypothetical protein
LEKAYRERQKRSFSMISVPGGGGCCEGGRRMCEANQATCPMYIYMNLQLYLYILVRFSFTHTGCQTEIFGTISYSELYQYR